MNIGEWYSYTGTPETSTFSHEAGIDVMVVSQNQINNTSLIRIRPWGLKLSGSTYNLNNQTLIVKADNSTKNSETSYDFREASTNEKFYLTNDYPFKRASGSGDLVGDAYVYDFTIKHENDGTKTIPIYALIPFHNSASGRDWEVDIEIELPAIARANTVVISKTYIDDPINIAINKTDDSFTTTLIYNAVNTDGTVTTEEIANKTANKNISYTISTEKLTTILSKNKMSTSVLGILYAYTYSGNTQIGQKSYDLTLNIEETPPIVSATVVDTNATTIALTGDGSKIIKYISKPKVTITAQAQQQADISSYSTVWGNSSSTAQETTFNSGIDSNIVTVSAKDSRNWVGEEEYDLSTLGRYIDYIKPNFSKFTLSRPETTSNTINADLTGVWFNSSFGATSNTLELKYRYKEKGGEYGDYQTITLTINENNFSLNGSLGSSFDYQKQIDFEFVLTDKLMSVITTFNVEKGESIIRVAETYVLIRGNLNIEGNLNISGNTNVDGNFTVNGSPLQTDVSWSKITGKPTFADVATSGAYADLSGRPSIPSKLTVTALRSSTSYNTSDTTLTNGANYEVFVLVGKVASSNSGYSTAVVVKNMIGTGGFSAIISDEANYVRFTLTLSGNDILFKHSARSSNGYVQYIYGVTI